jgi:hypothetical protein
VTITQTGFRSTPVDDFALINERFSKEKPRLCPGETFNYQPKGK